MSPALNGSYVLQCFKCRNTVQIRNRIMSEFYPGLQQIWLVHIATFLTISLLADLMSTYFDHNCIQYVWFVPCVHWNSTVCFCVGTCCFKARLWWLNQRTCGFMNIPHYMFTQSFRSDAYAQNRTLSWLYYAPTTVTTPMHHLFKHITHQTVQLVWKQRLFQHVFQWHCHVQSDVPLNTISEMNWMRVPSQLKCLRLETRKNTNNITRLGTLLLRDRTTLPFKACTQPHLTHILKGTLSVYTSNVSMPLPGQVCCY